MKFSSKIPANLPTGTRLIDYLSQRFTYHTREEWIEGIKRGKVMLDGLYPYLKDILKPGMVLDYDPGEFEEPPANLNYSIIYEDEWLLGVNKPANLLVHRAGRSFKNNLIYQLRHVHQPPYETAHTIHRLDRDTSGVILVAKNTDVRAEVGKQFLEANIEKEYIAIVHGIPDLAIHSQICLPIGKAQLSEVSYKFGVNPDGKHATTNIKQSVNLGENFAILTVMPLTGRTHQIRIHLAAIGHTIVGDKLYGMKEEEYLKWRDNPQDKEFNILFSRHALHCRRMSFFHPYLKKTLTIEAEMPEDMVELCEKLRGM